MRKIRIRSTQAPGDIMVLAGAISRLLHTFPNMFAIEVGTQHPAVFENNPDVTLFHPDDPDVETFDFSYEQELLEVMSGKESCPFSVGCVKALYKMLGIHNKPSGKVARCHIYLTPEEYAGTGVWKTEWGPSCIGKPYVLLNAGYKTDMTCKAWIPEYFEELLLAFSYTIFVQIGVTGAGYVQPALARRPNVVNLVDKTTLRDLIVLGFHSTATVTPVSLPMHIAGAVFHCGDLLEYGGQAVVLAGGRESQEWASYPGHAYLGQVCGQDCLAEGSEDACWRYRVRALTPEQSGRVYKNPRLNERTCAYPYGKSYAKCMHNISVQEVFCALDPMLDMSEKLRLPKEG